LSVEVQVEELAAGLFTCCYFFEKSNVRSSQA
jgi:hypothetical protein